MLRSRPARSAGRLLATAVAIALLGSLALLGGTACDDPGEPEIAPPGPPSLPTPPLTAEGLVAGIEIIYNDKVRTAAERLALYQNLFAPLDHDPGFKFYFVPDDVPPGEQPWWGIAEELQAHDNMFKAQEARNIDSLELSIQHLPAEDSVDHAGWKQVEATNVFLRLMFNRNDGIEVNGGRASFRCSPGEGRWYLNEWVDLPRVLVPGEPGERSAGGRAASEAWRTGEAARAVESTTWGAIKVRYK